MQLKPDVAARTDASAHWRAARTERIPDLGALRRTEPATWLFARLGGLLGGGRRIKVLEAMGRSGGLFWGYIPLGLAVVPGTRLTRVDCELATLRTAWNVGARYEWHHHVYAARWSGISVETVERVAKGPEAAGWTDGQRALLRAVDELHSDRMILDDTWDELSRHLSAAQGVDLCMLVGHYEMLAMLLKTHGIEPEPEMWRRGPFRWLRDPASGDGLAPAWLPKFNRAVTNRIARIGAGKLPPYTVVHHLGRKSGRAFETPVAGVYRDGLFIVPLLYGDRTDWVRNVLAAEGAEVTYRHRTRKLTAPRVVDAAAAVELPEPARLFTRLVKVLVAEVDS
ncbi:nitroreductase family deazaflavin-dependent oxidoreductase [Nocardia sp. CDC160]|uniref:nitroreductase family deazaflavin-dependent oxidoreductase n=1 Tax=Nocardia sp. CDC160 TaxID=3112166 RepID=UPI002DBC11CE|nr:nitroreductase family deazaflavin-dependent oxidoreductase [Nocardia sp. CDC160]MEC3919367.1 nitroreductase family deazaflavin-dependent oxidoreductase [Nocardia sp. CDC160]